MRYKINLLDDGSVVTKDGEYLGTWETDESDAFYEFIPDGDSTPLYSCVFRFSLCEAIDSWHNSSTDDSSLGAK